MDFILLSGIIISLIFAFFFSTMETAYRVSNKLQIQLESSLGRVSGRVMSLFTKHPSWFFGTTVIGSTISMVCVGAFAVLLSTPLLTTWLPESINNGPIIIAIQIITSAVLFFIAAVILPGSLSIQNPNVLLSRFALPFGICFIALFLLMYPVISFVRLVIIYVLKMKYDEQKPFFGTTDVTQYLRGISKVKPEAEDIAMNRKILHNALTFKTVKIRECMIPRTEITAAEANASIEELRSIFIESGHSKVIIYKQSIDEIIGYCHSSSLFKKPEKIQDILTPIIIVAETTLANELMIRFINERKSLAVVVDEFGGTSGIVSMEDVIEEIFGEIEDEHDEHDQLLITQKLYENTYLVSARLEIDYLNDTFQWELPTGEYETLGGLILSYAEDFPKQGQTIKVPPFTFTIQTTGDNRIETVIVKVENEGKVL
ncbi:MAG: hemolysin family protein [Cyclobacteriaceae bacterium]|nr:hemolysin family protein [Cyclobacteriaceae bacterium]MDH4296765.1 hemolysin family protein [Cyclobacteriaceae bacterium]MDH5248669.1 hemolysin family protein [Cyclobacteriaceae bacterium]